MNHAPLIFLGAFLTLASSWWGLVLVPQFQIGRQEARLTVGAETLYPVRRAGQAEQGRSLYVAYGCVQCHTLQVRPAALGSDFARGWGQRRSVAQDYLYDDPVQTGLLRIGPDLTNLALRRRDTNELYRILYQPQAVLEKSPMPPHLFLFERRRIGANPSPDRLQLAGVFAPPAGYEVVPRADARKLVAFLLSLQADAPLFEAPLPVRVKPAGTNDAAAPGLTNAPDATNLVGASNAAEEPKRHPPLAAPARADLTTSSNLPVAPSNNQLRPRPPGVP